MECHSRGTHYDLTLNPARGFMVNSKPPTYPEEQAWTQEKERTPQDEGVIRRMMRRAKAGETTD
eukprot:9323582-Heterocapsa_arctica.AAC.1